LNTKLDNIVVWVELHFLIIFDCSLLSMIIKPPNARINAAAHNEPSIQVSRMKCKLIPLALNELLDRP
jgi:hypothetical protein